MSWNQCHWGAIMEVFRFTLWSGYSYAKPTWQWRSRRFPRKKSYNRFRARDCSLFFISGGGNWAWPWCGTKQDVTVLDDRALLRGHACLNQHGWRRLWWRRWIWWPWWLRRWWRRRWLWTLLSSQALHRGVSLYHEMLRRYTKLFIEMMTHWSFGFQERTYMRFLPSEEDLKQY